MYDCYYLQTITEIGNGFYANKTNILNYRNPNLGHNKDWLYWWMTRLMLERVTEFCFTQAKKLQIFNPKIRIIFSRRSSNDYDEFKKYLAWLYSQSTAGGLYINTGDLEWIGNKYKTTQS